MASKIKQIRADLIKNELVATKSAQKLSNLQKARLAKSNAIINNKIDEIVGFLESNPATIYSISKRTELLNLIKSEFASLTSQQIKEIEKHLTSVYNTNRVMVSTKLGIPFNVTNEFQAQELLRRSSDGLTVSQRLWKNNETIAQRVNNDIGRMLYQKANPTEIKQMVAQDYNISYNAADRLIRTETSKFYNTAAIDSYKAAGIEEVQFLAEDDACEQYCQPNDGKIFPIGDNDVVPPLHPNCRCTILPVIKD